jgi:uncharacterized protein
MTGVFADAVYWVALLNVNDSLHERAARISTSLRNTRMITSDSVLTELLNDFANRGAEKRMVASSLVEMLLDGREVTVERQTPESFGAALELYRIRPDKSWSITDCASFLIMKRYGIEHALTYDHHFEQAGFKALLR